MKPSILILLAALLATQASARTWHVLNDGSGDAPTVQAGIDSAAVGDSVLVAAGTYFETINFLGKEIVVISTQGALATIIDGSNTPGSVVTFIGGEAGDYAVNWSDRRAVSGVYFVRLKAGHVGKTQRLLLIR